MNNLLAELYDIEGLDGMSWWPLAWGWWIVILLSFLTIALFFTYYYRKRMFKRSWKHEALKQLSALQHNLREDNAQATIAELSQFIRRIAMHQYSRLECAGLEGKVWLEWLKTHDPNQFDWERKGQWLTEAPYAPAGVSIPREVILDFIKAVRGWIK